MLVMVPLENHTILRKILAGSNLIFVRDTLANTNHYWLRQRKSNSDKRKQT